MNKHYNHKSCMHNKITGVALVTVLIMVFIIMSIIANITVQNYRTIRRISNQMFQDQAVAILHAAIDFARAGLSTSAANSNIDTLNDIWASPIPKTEIVDNITMSGYILDEQSKFNINDLVVNGSVNITVLKQFKNLLNYLNIPTSLADSIALYMSSPVNQTGIMSQYTNAKIAYRPSGKNLVDLSELLLIKGIDVRWVDKLDKYVTAIPNELVFGVGRSSTKNANIKININTAEAAVIAAKTNLPLDVAQRIVTIRIQTPFISVDKLKEFLIKNNAVNSDNNVVLDDVDIASNFFTLHAIINNGDYQFNWLAMLYREERSGLWPTILWQHVN